MVPEPENVRPVESPVRVIVVPVTDPVSPSMVVIAEPPLAACQLGKAAAPLLVKICPEVPTPTTFCRAPVLVVPPQMTE